MHRRFRLYRRRNGVYYCGDLETGSQESLGTKDHREAERLLHAMNLQIARAYLTAGDPEIATKTYRRR